MFSCADRTTLSRKAQVPHRPLLRHRESCGRRLTLAYTYFMHRLSLMKTRLLLSSLLVSVFAVVLSASDDAGYSASSAESRPMMAGPFEVLEIDMDFLQGVTYMNDRIYLKRQVDHRAEAITLRASMLKGEAYRKWFNGSHDLVSPANAGHQANAWTDWVETTANYVEYWVGDKKILHLKRTGS
jgi:hypothetical protein